MAQDPRQEQPPVEQIPSSAGGPPPAPEAMPPVAPNGEPAFVRDEEAFLDAVADDSDDIQDVCQLRDKVRERYTEGD